MKSQVLHTVICCIAGEAAGEIWTWLLLGLTVLFTPFFRAQIRVTVQGLFHLNHDIAAFKEHLRDFMVQIKVFQFIQLSPSNIDNNIIVAMLIKLNWCYLSKVVFTPKTPNIGWSFSNLCFVNLCKQNMLYCTIKSTSHLAVLQCEKIAKLTCHHFSWLCTVVKNTTWMWGSRQTIIPVQQNDTPPTTINCHTILKIGHGPWVFLGGPIMGWAYFWREIHYPKSTGLRGMIRLWLEGHLCWQFLT